MESLIAFIECIAYEVLKGTYNSTCVQTMHTQTGRLMQVTIPELPTMTIELWFDNNTVWFTANGKQYECPCTYNMDQAEDAFYLYMELGRYAFMQSR